MQMRSIRAFALPRRPVAGATQLNRPCVMTTNSTNPVQSDAMPGDAQKVSSRTSKAPCARARRLDQALGAVVDMLGALGFDADAVSASVIDPEGASSGSDVVPVDKVGATRLHGRGVDEPGPARAEPATECER